MPCSSGTQVIKIITAVIYKFLYQAKVFVPWKPFQLSLMFGCEARAYSSGALFKDTTLKLFY